MLLPSAITIMDEPLRGFVFFVVVCFVFDRGRKMKVRMTILGGLLHFLTHRCADLGPMACPCQKYGVCLPTRFRSGGETIKPKPSTRPAETDERETRDRLFINNSTTRFRPVAGVSYAQIPLTKRHVSKLLTRVDRTRRVDPKNRE